MTPRMATTAMATFFPVLPLLGSSLEHYPHGWPCFPLVIPLVLLSDCRRVELVDGVLQFTGLLKVFVRIG